MNPGTAATTAHITYMFADGTTQTQDVPIGATTRATVKVNDVVGPDKDVSIKVEASAPIVAERPMYFNYGESGPGATMWWAPPAPQTTFLFAEGYTGAGFDEWLCLMNPDTAATTAHITYMFADGTTQTQDVPIGPTTRATVKVNDIVGPDKDVSIKVEARRPHRGRAPHVLQLLGFLDRGARRGGVYTVGFVVTAKRP